MCTSILSYRWVLDRIMNCTRVCEENWMTCTLEHKMAVKLQLCCADWKLTFGNLHCKWREWPDVYGHCPSCPQHTFILGTDIVNPLQIKIDSINICFSNKIKELLRVLMRLIAYSTGQTWRHKMIFKRESTIPSPY